MAQGFSRAMFESAAQLNRAIMRLWPDWAGKSLIWQVLKRTLNRIDLAIHDRATELVGETVWGGRFHCDLRDLIQSRIYYSGVWEPSLTRYIQDRLRPGDTFVDVGANIGYFSVLAAKLVGSAGRVVAIEASPGIFGRLQRALAMNDAANVTALHVAVAAQRGMVEIFPGPARNIGATSLLNDGHTKPEALVEAAPLREILHESWMHDARMFKIDVEGFEAPVLRDLLDALPRLRNDVEILVEIAPQRLVRSGVEPRELFGEFRRAGFHWLFLHNDYSWAGDYRTDANPPVGTEVVPEGQTDVVFRRAR